MDGTTSAMEWLGKVGVGYGFAFNSGDHVRVPLGDGKESAFGQFIQQVARIIEDQQLG